MSFFGSLFGGQNKDLNNDIAQSGAISGFATGQGEGDTTAASSFYRDILSGDPSQEASALAPEISAEHGRVNQQRKTNAEFGTRSGGTAASTANADTAANTDILNLEGGLKSGAASGAASLGTAEQGIGLQANAQNASQSQQRMQNWLNSILGKGITGAAQAGESALIGGASGSLAGGSFSGGAAAGLSDFLG